MLMVYSFPSKTSKVIMEQAAPFSIMPVFSQRFPKQYWKTAILDCNQSATNELLVSFLTIDNGLVKLAHVLLAKKSFCPTLAEAYLKEQKLIPRAVYVLLFKLTTENRRSFQFKRLHNIIPTNQCLWKMNFPPETTNHTFCECPAMKGF